MGSYMRNSKESMIRPMVNTMMPKWLKMRNVLNYCTGRLKKIISLWF